MKLNGPCLYYNKKNKALNLFLFWVEIEYRLLKSVDELKDQSFFLSQIEPDLLRHVLFPIGEMNKKEVRKVAFDLGLKKVFNKKSSVGICFIGKRDFQRFIGNYLETKKGDLVDIETNEFLGEHNGIYNFTVGQRVPLENKFNKDKKPYFVAKKDKTSNKIFLVIKFQKFKDCKKICRYFFIKG